MSSLNWKLLKKDDTFVYELNGNIVLAKVVNEYTPGSYDVKDIKIIKSISPDIKAISWYMTDVISAKIKLLSYGDDVHEQYPEHFI